MNQGTQTAPQTTHVCLIWTQLSANITAALDRRLDAKAVVLARPAERERQAEALARVLRQRGLEAIIWPLPSAHDVAALRESFLSLVVRYERQTLVLNTTGGSKAMSMAAFEVFRGLERAAFFVQVDTDQLVWLHPSERPSFNLDDRINLRTFLAVHGATVAATGNTHGVPAERRGLVAQLVAQRARFATALPRLNWYANASASDLESPPVRLSHLEDPDFQALLKLLAEHGLVSARRGRLRFPNEAARFFVNGGWLEDYVYGLAFGLRSKIAIIQDLAPSVSVVRAARVRNELDVAILANNRLFIVECKTKRFGHDPDDMTGSADTLYKLDTLKGLLGGLSAEAMLVSYFPIGHWDRLRAEDLGIHVVDGPRLDAAERLLTTWLKRAHNDA